MLTEEEYEQIQKEKRQAYKQGIIAGIKLYSWWRDGIQYVGTCGTTLKFAIEEVEKEVKV